MHNLRPRDPVLGALDYRRDVLAAVMLAGGGHAVKVDPLLIYDVGLHLGEDAEFYLRKGFRVVGIEALPAHCSATRERLHQFIDSGQLTILNVAITETTGPTRFFINDTISVWGTTSPQWAAWKQKSGTRYFETTVDGIEFTEVLKEFGIPHYLKIDIEGADLLCIRALANFGSRPNYISHESTTTCWSDLREEFRLLRELGYSRFKVVNQATVPERLCRFPAKEGVYVNHRFEAGSSGLFGQELPGPWLSEHEALKHYKTILRYSRFFGEDSLIYRFRLGRKLMGITGLNESWYDTHAAR